MVGYNESVNGPFLISFLFVFVIYSFVLCNKSIKKSFFCTAAKKIADSRVWLMVGYNEPVNGPWSIKHPS